MGEIEEPAVEETTEEVSHADSQENLSTPEDDEQVVPDAEANENAEPGSS